MPKVREESEVRRSFIFPDRCQSEQTVLNRTNMLSVYRSVPIMTNINHMW